ncbi:Glutamate dehydrogenase 2, partial [Bienertia sinuspersici]
MGATKPTVTSRTPPTLIETTTLNKIPNENLVSSEPIQPLHHPFMHMNEDTQHVERSPPSIHAVSESRIEHDLEDSSESEDINQGGGRDVCATKAISSGPRCRTIIPNWPEHVKFDEKEDAIAFSKHGFINLDGKRHLVKGPVQPRDVWNDRELRYHVQFNDFNQPLRKGMSILVSFLGDVAKREAFCPIGLSSLHKLKKKMKADIVILVRKLSKLGKMLEHHLDILTSVVPQALLIEELNFYTKKDGSFKEGTLSQQFMEDANNKVKECLASSSSKSRVDIKNEVFNDLMYDVVKKQNEDLQQKNQALESKFDDTIQSVKVIASHLAQVLKEVRNRNASTHLLDGAESAIKLIDSQ